jgi:glucokinase
MAELFLGVDVGGTTIKLGVCSADGTTMARTSIDTNAECGPDVAVTRIAETARRLSTEAGATVAACGIGVPGELDLARTTLLRANHLPGWTDVPFPARLGERLNVPTRLENDSNCAAWAELRIGTGRGARSLVCFTLGTGIGGGIVIDAQLWLGSNGAAGALGHIAIDPNGPRCKCGQNGCVEQYASATAVAARYGRGSARDAFEAAARGDPHAIATIDDACDALAAAVASVIHTLQPDVVVLAGGMAAAGGALLDRVRAGVARRVRPAWLSHIRIELSSLGSDAGWIGAALLAAEHTR